MPPVLESMCLGVFLILMITPGLYGLHLYLLMANTLMRLRRVRRSQRATVARFQAETADEDWPVVTTQIPIYNELAVARRVIEAVARLDYPRGRHEIQVLDDSTDGTRAVVDQVCARFRRAGRDIRVIRRENRQHFKAGALEHGLAQARGEFVAIFDADFVPPPEFLRQIVPLLAADPDACCAQGRWAHLNANDNWMTDALALGIDGHFGIEQGGRAWAGLLLNFNGTAGVWRRSAIEDPRVGGWQGDTITEDLDLSYRAQLAGWRIIYAMDLRCPAEVPGDVDAIKAQQRRWATGSIQTARKLLPRVWASGLTLAQKLEASIHLTQYSISLFMVLMALFGRTLLWLIEPQRYQSALAVSWWIVMFAAAAPSIAYIVARYALGGGITGPGRILKLIVLGLGLSVNNACAVLAGFVQRGGEFVRTPKSGSDGRCNGGGPYAALRSRLWLAELLLGVYCFVQWALFLEADRYVGGTFLLLYAIGLTMLGWASRPKTSGRRRQPRPASPSATAPHPHPTVAPTAPSTRPAMQPTGAGGK